MATSEDGGLRLLVSKTVRRGWTYQDGHSRTPTAGILFRNSTSSSTIDETGNYLWNGTTVCQRTARIGRVWWCFRLRLRLKGVGPMKTDSQRTCPSCGNELS